jgi:hypothetical protein
MKNYGLISVLALSSAMSLPAAAASGRTPITAEQVAYAISGTGTKVSAQQVTLLADVVASAGNPTLRVESMEQWGAHRMMVRMNCTSSDQCLPFLVALSWSDGDAGYPAMTGANRRLAPDSPAKPVVRSGSPAILLLDGDHLHIQLAVICLENGVIGQTIRVATTDHRMTFSAQVVDETVLKGRL